MRFGQVWRKSSVRLRHKVSFFRSETTSYLLLFLSTTLWVIFVPRCCCDSVILAAVVEQVSGALSESQTAIVAEYRGLTVEKMTSLRREAREAGVFFQVVKNTLARRAVKGSDFECLDEHFVGPLALAASEDPVAAAKVLSKFEKANDEFSIKIGAMSGSLLSQGDISALAKLPLRGLKRMLKTVLTFKGDRA